MYLRILRKSFSTHEMLLLNSQFSHGLGYQNIDLESYAIKMTSLKIFYLGLFLTIALNKLK